MFVFTAKFTKRKAAAIIIALAVILTIIIILAGIGSKSGTMSRLPELAATVSDENGCVNYLTSLGWQVEDTPLEKQDITIPKEFNDVYANYNEIQKAQGFDLLDYAGLECTRYTYKVTNYPGVEGGAVADIIVYNNAVIGGDVQSVALDGFMQGLKYPENK